MLIRTKSRHTSIKTSIGISILAGAAVGILIALLTSYSTQAVQADADISRPVVITPASPVESSPTPVFLVSEKTVTAIATKKRIGIIHGIASWYGGVFDGRKTANGEMYDMHALTACQPDLPFGSIVRVINRSNKRSVVVRINDRGDLVDESRIIDLSWAAAERLAMTKSGLAKVDVEILSLGGPRGGR
jgi:rare lipoprotein A (peptidoglycan hydrolase)